MQPTKIASYDPEVDIAMICLEERRPSVKSTRGGLIDRDRDTERLMGFEIWRASTVLPSEMIEALRTADKPRGVAA